MKLNKSWILWGAVNISRIVIAIALLFSGWVKVLDPMGMVYKLRAYSDYFGIGLADESLWLKIAVACLAVVECQLGLSILLGIRRKSSTIFAFLFMLVMTGVTIFVYAFEPVADCGCFGDALKLTNGETLTKNVVLLLLAVLMMLYPRRMRRFISERNQWIISIYSFTFLISLLIYSFYYTPLLSFTDYKVGVDVVKQYNGDVPEGEDLLESVVNFSATNEQGEDVTADIFNANAVNFVLTIPNVLTADDSSADRINKLQDFALDNGYGFYALMGNDLSLSKNWRDRTGSTYLIYQVDEVILKSMVRDNPGVMLIENGVIRGIWGNNEIPEDMNLLPLTSQGFVEIGQNRLMMLLLLYIIPLIFVMLVDAVWIGQKYVLHNAYMKKLLDSELLKD